MPDYLTIPGSGLVLEDTNFQGQKVYRDVNKTAWWDATRVKEVPNGRNQWYDLEVGVTYLYCDDDGYLTGRQFEATRPKKKAGYTFEDGSTVRQVGEDELTRFRVSDLVQCEIVTAIIEWDNKITEENDVSIE